VQYSARLFLEHSSDLTKREAILKEGFAASGSLVAVYEVSDAAE